MKIDPAKPSVDELFLSNLPFLRKIQIEKGGLRRKRYAGAVRMEDCELLVKLKRWSSQKDFEPILRLGWWWHEENDNRTFALTIDNALKAVNDTMPSPSERTVENMQRLTEILKIGPKNALVVGDVQRRLGNLVGATEAYREMPPHQSELSGQLITLSHRGYRSVVRLK